MTQPQTPSHKAEFTGLPPRKLTFVEGVAIIFGTNIGAGILSLPYASRNGGFTMLLVSLLVAATGATISMLYVAEVSLRTRDALQLSGLAQRYLGSIGSWLVLIALIINGLGALIAYTTGSGEILHQLFGLPELIGSILFYIPSVAIVWFGLKTTAVSEYGTAIGLLALVTVLSVWTLIKHNLHVSNLTFAKPYYLFPLFNLTVFAFVAQYLVPELARGFSHYKARLLPYGVIAGMCLCGFVFAFVPLVTLGAFGPDNLTEIITLVWGNSLGAVAYYIANIFALLAFFSSFWAIALALVTNYFDRFNWPADGPYLYRIAAVALAVVPPFIIGVLDLATFVSALGYAGGIAGAIMSIVPVLMLRKARIHGDRPTDWQGGWYTHPAAQVAVVTVFMLGFVYVILEMSQILPPGWG